MSEKFEILGDGTIVRDDKITDKERQQLKAALDSGKAVRLEDVLGRKSPDVPNDDVALLERRKQIKAGIKNTQGKTNILDLINKKKLENE